MATAAAGCGGGPIILLIVVAAAAMSFASTLVYFCPSCHCIHHRRCHRRQRQRQRHHHFFHHRRSSSSRRRRLYQRHPATRGAGGCRPIIHHCSCQTDGQRPTPRVPPRMTMEATTPTFQHPDLSSLRCPPRDIISQFGISSINI